MLLLLVVVVVAFNQPNLYDLLFFSKAYWLDRQNKQSPGANWGSGELQFSFFSHLKKPTSYFVMIIILNFCPVSSFHRLHRVVHNQKIITSTQLDDFKAVAELYLAQCGARGLALCCTLSPFTASCLCAVKESWKKKRKENTLKMKKTAKLLRGIFRSFLHLVLDVPWHALFTFGIGKKGLSDHPIKVVPLQRPNALPLLSLLGSTHWEKAFDCINSKWGQLHLFIKAPFWRW